MHATPQNLPTPSACKAAHVMNNSCFGNPLVFIVMSAIMFACGKSDDTYDEGVRVTSAKIEIGPEQLADYRVFDAFSKGDVKYLVGYNAQASSLDFFDVTNRKLLSAKPLDRSGPNAVMDVISFSVRNDSLVWFATLNSFIIYNLNQHKAIQMHSLKDLNDRFSLARYSYFFDNRGKLVVLNDTTVVVSAAHFPLYDGNSNLSLASLNVSRGTVKDLAPGIPEWINAANHYGGLNTMHFYHDDGEIIYNFPFMDSVFTWSLNDRSIKRQRYGSKIIPGVLAPYRGDGSMESIIFASSRSDYYAGVRPVTGTGKQYRFVVSTDGNDEVSYATYLEAFNGTEISYSHKLSPQTKTRGFTSRDSIFLFVDSGNEEYLKFLVFTEL